MGRVAGLEIVRHILLEDRDGKPFPCQRVRSIAMKASGSVKISSVTQNDATIRVTGSGFSPARQSTSFANRGIHRSISVASTATAHLLFQNSAADTAGL